MFAPEIGGRSGFIFPEYTGQLGGTVVAYLTGNLLDGEVRVDEKLFGRAQPFLVKTEEIGLANVLFEESADIVGMHFYRFCQVIQGDIVLIIFPDIFQELLDLSIGFRNFEGRRSAEVSFSQKRAPGKFYLQARKNPSLPE